MAKAKFQPGSSYGALYESLRASGKDGVSEAYARQYIGVRNLAAAASYLRINKGINVRRIGNVGIDGAVYALKRGCLPTVPAGGTPR